MTEFYQKIQTDNSGRFKKRFKRLRKKALSIKGSFIRYGILYVA